MIMMMDDDGEWSPPHRGGGGEESRIDFDHIVLCMYIMHVM